MATKKTAAKAALKTADKKVQPVAAKAPAATERKIIIKPRIRQRYLQLGALITDQPRLIPDLFRDRIVPVNGTIPIPKPGRRTALPTVGGTMPPIKLIKNEAPLILVEAVELPGSELVAEVYVRFVPRG